MKKTAALFLFSILYLLFSIKANAQQTLRGSVKDQESKATLIGANVAVYKDTVLIGGNAADADGYYKIDNIPFGRYTVVATYLGYNKAAFQNIIVNAAKETILNIELEESVVEMKEVSIAGARKGEVLNEMAVVSARAFSVEESDRYAGSRGDPARMASNFAGVSGADDSRNDITVRGNSPFGVLYRMENVNIPNPNHFAVAGTAGGPVGILNNKVLANSDFMTGAFPAEYGNAISAVFDLKMRNGNDQKHEFTAQLGLFGTELTAEGPISKKSHASYLVNYRYSTIVLFSAMGIDLGTDAKPYYQDASFKFNFPTKKAGTFSIFGLGGVSKIDILTNPDKTAETRELYGDADKDEYFRSGMGVAGLNWLLPLDDKSYLRTTLAVTGDYTKNHRDIVYRHKETADSIFVVDSLVPELEYNFTTTKYSANLFYNRKFNAQHTLRAGIYTDMLQFNYQDSSLIRNEYRFEQRLRDKSIAYLLQPYLQWAYRITEQLTFNAGLHSQYFTLNTSSYSIEPRAGLKWRFKPTQSINFGFGMHSQTQPYYIYLQEHSSGQQENKGLPFMRSTHYVLGYDNALTPYLRIKLETYYQKLNKIPVDTFPSSYSVLNEGTSFDRYFPGKLVAEGTAENYGIELTIEKFYNRNYFFMFSGTLYNSTYKPADGKTYDTDFNGNYIVNLLGTKEFKWGKKRPNTFGIGGKLTTAGGRRYTPIDVAASDSLGKAVIIDSERNSLQYKYYFRFDVKINYAINARKLRHEIGVDLVNVAQTKNVLRKIYVGGPEPIKTDYQLGFLPVFYYRVDF
ncbi:MAG: carboxypeptidase-like regulatory domain-containing protein [Bacteroidia bacterium]